MAHCLDVAWWLVSHLMAEALWELIHINEIGYCHTPTLCTLSLMHNRYILSQINLIPAELLVSNMAAEWLYPLAFSSFGGSRMQDRWGRYCIFMIRWSLLGSYVCLMTMRLVPVEMYLLLRTMFNLWNTKLLLLVGSRCSNWQVAQLYWEHLLLWLLHCTVYNLEYVPVANIIGRQL